MAYFCSCTHLLQPPCPTETLHLKHQHLIGAEVACFLKLLLPPYLRILEHNLTTKSTACSTWTTPVHSGTLLPPPLPVTTHYIMGDCSLLPFTQKTECFSAGNCAAAHTECRTFHSLRSLHAQVHCAHPGRQLQSPDRSAPKTLDLAFSNHQFITKSNHGISSCGATENLVSFFLAGQTESTKI